MKRIVSPEEAQVTQYDPADADFMRVADKLTDFTMNEKGGPRYEELRFAFRAAVNGVTVGELAATELWGAMEVNHLHVDAAHRGQGIGGKLMEAVEDLARARKDACVHLWTPTFQGEGFYERQGYQELSRLPLQVTLNNQRQYRIHYAKTLA